MTTIKGVLLAIAQSPEDSIQLEGVYRTLTPAQINALERTVERLLPVHSSQLLQPLRIEYPLEGLLETCTPRREVQS